MQTNEIPSGPMDVILFPSWVHKKISVNYKGLLIVFLFVGVFDLVFYKDIFATNLFMGSIEDIILRTILLCVMSIVLGAIDVICVMIPISELAAFIGKRSEKFIHTKFNVIMMKSYAISHLVFVIPYAAYIYSGVEWESIDASSSAHIRLIFSILSVIIFISQFVQLGVLNRTIFLRTRIERFGRLILILAAFFWMQLAGSAVGYIASIFFGIIENLGAAQILSLTL